MGIVANNPMWLAGCLDINASIKAARFVRFCDSFNIPIITFEDQPGFLPGVQQEYGGDHPPRLQAALCLLRGHRAPDHGHHPQGPTAGPTTCLASKHHGADLNFAYPTAEIAVMGPEGAVNIVFRKELAGAEDPAAMHAQLVEEYRRKFASPYKAAELGYIDEIILPQRTRSKLIKALWSLRNKKVHRAMGKHGNIPL